MDPLERLCSVYKDGCPLEEYICEFLTCSKQVSIDRWTVSGVVWMRESLSGCHWSGPGGPCTITSTWLVPSADPVSSPPALQYHPFVPSILSQASQPAVALSSLSAVPESSSHSSLSSAALSSLLAAQFTPNQRRNIRRKRLFSALIPAPDQSTVPAPAPDQSPVQASEAVSPWLPESPDPPWPPESPPAMVPGSGAALEASCPSLS